jgi:hypothetical protein
MYRHQVVHRLCATSTLRLEDVAFTEGLISGVAMRPNVQPENLVRPLARTSYMHDQHACNAWQHSTCFISHNLLYDKRKARARRRQIACLGNLRNYYVNDEGIITAPLALVRPASNPYRQQSRRP